MRTLFLFVVPIIAMSLLPAEEPLTLARAIELPRVDGRIAHLASDAMANLRFVAALGNNPVEVLDVKAGTHIKSLQGFREPQGIAIAPDAKVVAVANGQGEGAQFLSVDD